MWNLPFFLESQPSHALQDLQEYCHPEHEKTNLTQTQEVKIDMLLLYMKLHKSYYLCYYIQCFYFFSVCSWYSIQPLCEWKQSDHITTRPKKKITKIRHRTCKHLFSFFLFFFPHWRSCCSSWSRSSRWSILPPFAPFTLGQHTKYLTYSHSH